MKNKNSFPVLVSECATVTQLRFDRACIAIKSLETAFTAASSPILKNVDVYEFLKLRPAVFVLKNLDHNSETILADAQLDPAQQAKRDALIRELTPADGHDAKLNREVEGARFLKEVANGYGITFQNATKIADFIHGWGAPLPLIGPLESRANKVAGKKMQLRCNAHEAPFLSLDPSKLRRLQQLVSPAPPEESRGEPA